MSWRKKVDSREELIPNGVLAFPKSVETDERPDKKSRQGFIGGPAAFGRARTSKRFPCSRPKRGQAGSLHGVRVGVCPGFRWEGWLSADSLCSSLLLFPTPLLLLQALQKQLLDLFGLFCILLSIICPNCPWQLFLVPYSFFVFCGLRRCLSRCKHWGKGSQVPACLRVAASPWGTHQPWRPAALFCSLSMI